MTFLALRSYLPADHPDKGKEIGSEPTPAAFLDTLLALTAEWGRVLAPHGSICVELGDTYAGSGGAGGDYGDEGWRAGQLTYRQQQQVAPPDGRGPRIRDRRTSAKTGNKNRDKRPGWPLDKSLCGIPDAYALSLEYGRNILRAPLSARELLTVAVHIINDADDGQDISATSLVMALQAFLTEHEERAPAVEYERWRVRNKVAWVRPNPPVGALGDKFRPATSYLTIACRARDRYFDLDAVRTPHTESGATRQHGSRRSPGGGGDADIASTATGQNPAGAPPLDWWNHTDQLIDDELQRDHGQPSAAAKGGRYMPSKQKGLNEDRGDKGAGDFGATRGLRGSHIRRRLEAAGYLGGPTDDVWDIAPSGYPGAHYAVYPPELCTRPILTMTPRRVCTTCGEPSRRIVGEAEYERPNGDRGPAVKWASGVTDGRGAHTSKPDGQRTRVAPTLGWSDCGHGTWRPGHVLDPFAGTGTTLAVATGHGREATGIDLDPRNADLAQQRVGMFLTIDHGTRQETA